MKALPNDSKEKLEKFYREEFDFNEKDIEYIFRVSKLKNFELAVSRINDINEFFKTTKPQLRQILVECPQILNYTKEKLQRRAEFLESNYNLEKEKFRINVACGRTRYVSYSEERFLSQEKFLELEYGISHDEFCRILNTFWGDNVFACSPERIKQIELYYFHQFGVSKETFVKMLLKSPIILSYNVDKVLEKQSELEKAIGLTEEKFIEMLQRGRSDIIKNKPAVFLATQKFYEEKCGITKEEFAVMLSKKPISSSCERFISNFNMLAQAGVDKSVLINNPAVLAENPIELKVRFMISELLGIDHNTFFKGNSMQRASKTYARIKFMQDNNIDLQKNLRLIYREEPGFKTKTKTTSEVLMDKYPLDKKALEQIVGEYKALQKANSSVGVDFSREEEECYGK